MKKLLSLALILMVCCSAGLMLGCSSENGKMTITPNPVVISITQDTIDDEMAYIDFVDTQLKGITVIVADEEGAELFNGNAFDARKQGASIIGFSLKTAGKGTAKISMFGVTESFEYEVTIS